MVTNVLRFLIKLVMYVAFVVLAVYVTPKVLARVLHTDYPLATITSGSMWPTLKTNDLILMRGISGKEAEVGQIVIYRNQKGFTIHRLIRKSGTTLVTKGDANSVEDSPIKERDVIGRAVYVGKKPFRIPALGAVAKNLGPKLQDFRQDLEKNIN